MTDFVQPKGEARPLPADYTNAGVRKLWTHWLQVEIDKDPACEGIEFKRGDKTVRVSLQEIAERLGFEW